MANLPNAAYIGSVFLHGWNGRLTYLQYQVDDYARIGQTGSGAQIVGTRSPKCQISAWVGTATRVDAVRIADALEAYQGQSVAVGDDMGRTFARVRILQITAHIKAGYGGNIAGGAQMLYRVDVNATMEALP